MIKLCKYKLDELNEPLAVIDLQLIYDVAKLSDNDIKLVRKLASGFGYYAIFEKGVINTYAPELDIYDIKKYEQKYGKFLEITTYVKDFVLFVPIHTTFLKNVNSLTFNLIRTGYKPTYESYLKDDPSIRRLIAYNGYLWEFNNMIVGYDYNLLNYTAEICTDLLQNKPIQYTNINIFGNLFYNLNKFQWVNEFKLPTDYSLYLRGINKSKNCAVCIFNYEMGKLDVN